MNPGKRRKMQKIEFLKKAVEENVKKLEQSLDTELVQKVTETVVEKVSVVEESSVPVEQEVKTSKKKKVV